MTPDILKQRWYLLCHPWTHSEHAGFTILAGSDDPHRATIIADLEPFDDEPHIDTASARAAAQHIVELHNASLPAKPSLLVEMALTDYEKERINDLSSALRELVDLKSLKDAEGKTEEYQERQPLAWERARELLAGFSEMENVE